MKNPKECFSIVQNQTFIVLNELTRPECKDGSEPLTFHHETFSRFNFVIIRADKKATTANIPVREIPGIFEKVHDLKMKHLLTGQRRSLREPGLHNNHQCRQVKGQDPCGSPGRGWGKGRESVKEPGTVAEAEPGRISKECSTDSGNRGSVTALS